MKIKNSITLIVFLFIYCTLSAQNNKDLQSISKQKLESFLKEHKQVRFVTTNGSNGPEIKFYVENNKPEPKALVQPSANAGAAVNFHLVKDINVQTDANPVNPGLNLNSDGAYAILNNIMYFSAYDGVNGQELWRSDGTAAGTFMVRDFMPGISGSFPSEIIVVGNKLVFATQTNNYSLWVSDGTAAGTTLLKDNIGYGPGVNSMYQLTNVGGTVYFFINYNTQLWKTNGTVAGTTMVKDFGADGIAPFLPVAANGLLCFTINTNANGRELWRSDGTDAGTFMLKDINPFIDFFTGPGQLTAFNNKLYFTANDGNGRKLWLTDGTSTGTVPATGQNNVLFPEDILVELFNRPFVVIGSNFYTGAITGTTGMELYKYNAATGFGLVKDITPGMPGGQFYYYEKLGNSLAFTYYDTLNHQNQLWRSGGTAASTVLIKSYGSDSVSLTNLHAGGNLLYFTSNASNGYELWKTNGTPAGTSLVKDIYTGVNNSNPANLTVYKGKTYFKAASKNAGTELWQTDGTEAGTVMMPEINASSTSYSAPDYSYNNYNSNPGAALGKKLYFSATTPETGYELYRSNGTAAGTTVVSDMAKGEPGSTPRNFINKNHAVYFLSYASSGNSINKVDSAGIVKTLATFNGYFRSYDVADNGLVFYVITNYLTGKTELWRVAGNGTGNIMLSDKLADNTYRFSVKIVNNKAFFSAADENGTELWVSNGTVAGTKRVKDIYAGGNGSGPFSLYAYNNNIFFGADDGSGAALWRSDGTEAGTLKVKDIKPVIPNTINADYNDFFCVVNNILYLNASAYGGNGYELWKTNGTPAGTVLVKDLSPGPQSSNPAFLTNVNGTLFFSLYNYQLWKSDGTTNGTVIVKDNIYSTDYYLFTERCVADGKLFFNAGHLLWVSDGTDAGTHQVADNGLDGVSNIKNLVAADNIVYFNGTTDQYNAELYAGDATKVTSKTIAVVKQVQQPSFSAVVLQNPLQSQLKLQVQSSVPQTLLITVSNTNRNIIAQQTVNAIKGSNQFTLNASNWQTGFHAVKISNTKAEMVSLKVLK